MTLKLIFLILGIFATSTAVTFLRRQERYRSSLHRKYLLSVAGMVIIAVLIAESIETVNPDLNIPTLLLQGSALIVAVLGFAAQPVIINIICGLLISIQKPFEIGDRIIVEGQEPGVVEDITLRHTVLSVYDGVRTIIPNGELNSKVVTNTSYGMADRRGLHVRFSVSYDADVPKAIEVIRDCVAASPYTLSVETNGIKEDSGPVYFAGFEDSSLLLRTTIWVSKEVNGFQAITDVNLRVLEAFRKYGIEIPYPYFNVLQGEYTPTVATEVDEKERHSVQRYRKTVALRMAPGENRLDEAIEVSRQFAAQQRMSARSAMQLELLTEETIGLMQQFTEQSWREFWVEGSTSVYRVHLRTFAKVNSLDEYQKLIQLSTTGRNEAAKSLNMRIAEVMLIGRDKLLKKKGQAEPFEWKLSEEKMDEEEIGKSILGKMASDVRVSVTEKWIELIVMKKNDKP